MELLFLQCLFRLVYRFWHSRKDTKLLIAVLLMAQNPATYTTSITILLNFLSDNKSLEELPVVCLLVIGFTVLTNYLLNHRLLNRKQIVQTLLLELQLLFSLLSFYIMSLFLKNSYTILGSCSLLKVPT